MSNLGLGLGLGLVLRLITLKTSHLVALNSTSPPSRLSSFYGPFYTRVTSQQDEEPSASNELAYYIIGCITASLALCRLANISKHLDQSS